MSAEGELLGADYSHPDRYCDIVMKGGITSGVVYPHAICDLAQTYRFKSVGGTSAGAIAAAATAAAEYGRGSGGFVRLAGLPDELGADGKLKSLFQPQRSTRRLFRVLIGALEHGTWGVIGAAIVGNFLTALVGAAPGAALLFLSAIHWADQEFDALAVLGCAVGAAVLVLGAGAAVTLRLARIAVRNVPDNNFGICSGATTGKSDRPGLTQWLADLLNDAAGLRGSKPLTFAHLWAGPEGDWQNPPAPGERFLDLQMMTTNLVNRVARRLPWEEGGWYFDPDEFRALFPVAVVEWMEAHPPALPTANSKRRGTEVHRAMMLPRRPVPAAADLPVVVAARLSLSFPVLLSAVPLWRFDFERPSNAAAETRWSEWLETRPADWRAPVEGLEDWQSEGAPNERLTPEPCWFSDGGISSNFPIHFFDRLVPGRPTFAINLRPFGIEEMPDPQNQAKNVWMPKANNEAFRPWWYRLPERRRIVMFKDTRLLEFLRAAVGTMQNRVDEAQMRAPGYRDRITHVKLSKKEGGMNLTMSKDRIDNLTARGREAAELLRTAYTSAPDPKRKISWDNHRWVRLRSALSALEQMHEDFAQGYDGVGADIEAGRAYQDLLDRPKETSPTSYELGVGQRDRANREVERIRVLGGEGDADTLSAGAPRPTPVGRIVPRD